jgi:hypothetical protein
MILMSPETMLPFPANHFKWFKSHKFSMCKAEISALFPRVNAINDKIGSIPTGRIRSYFDKAETQVT